MFVTSLPLFKEGHKTELAPPYIEDSHPAWISRHAGQVGMFRTAPKLLGSDVLAIITEGAIGRKFLLTSQTKPVSSRAIALLTFGCGLPMASRQYHWYSLAFAFHAMARYRAIPQMLGASLIATWMSALITPALIVIEPEAR